MDILGGCYSADHRWFKLGLGRTFQVIWLLQAPLRQSPHLLSSLALSPGPPVSQHRAGSVGALDGARNPAPAPSVGFRRPLQSPQRPLLPQAVSALRLTPSAFQSAPPVSSHSPERQLSPLYRRRSEALKREEKAQATPSVSSSLGQGSRPVDSLPSPGP